MGRDYRRLKIYQLSYDFVLEIYTVLPDLPENELRNMYSQLQRAATSVVLNIVEGCSNRSNKVFLNHLQYSYGSCKEMQVLLQLCYDLSYIDKDVFTALMANLEELSASLYKFMQSVEKEVFVNRQNYALL